MAFLFRVLCSSIRPSMRNYWATNKGASVQELSIHALSLTGLHSGSSTSKTPNPQQNRDCYGKQRLNNEQASSFEQTVAVSPESKLGYKLLALPEALTAATRPTADETSNVSMDAINYFRACVIIHTGQLRARLSLILTHLSVKEMQIFVNMIRERGETSLVLGPQIESGTTRKIFAGTCHSQKQTASSRPHPTNLKSNKVLRSYPLRPDRHSPLSASLAHLKTAENLGRVDSRKVFSRNIWEPFPLPAVPS